MPGDVEDLRSSWILDVQGFIDAMRRVKTETTQADELLKKTGDTGEDAMEKVERSGSRLGDLFSRLKLAVVGFFASFGASLAIRQMVQLNASLEEIQISFETMLGDGAKARDLIADIFAFAESTPFRQEDLLAGAKALLAFGEEADNITPTLRRLGDVSAGLNIPIRELAELYGKARTQGRLFQEDINQLTGRGIPIIAELAKQFGVMDTEVRGLVENGRVGFANLEEAFRSMTAEGGQFAGLTQRLSESFNGLKSTLFDQLSAILRDLGTGVFQEVRGDLENLVASLQRARESDGFKDTLAQISEALAQFIRGIRQAGAFLIEHGATIAKLVAVLATWRVSMAALTAAQAAFNIIVGAGAGAIGLVRAAGFALQGILLLLTGRISQATVAFQLFNTTVKANPIALVVSLITTAITALVLFRDRTDDATEAQAKMARQLQENVENIRQLTGAGLANELAKISEESQRVSEETGKLRAALTGSGNIINVDGVVRTRAQAQDQLVAGETRLAQIGKEVAEIESQINNDLEKRLGFLQETIRLITSRTTVTEKDREEVAKITQEVKEIQETLDARRGAGSSFSVIGVDPKKEAQALEKLRESLEALERQAKLASASTSAEAGKLRELFSVYDDLDRLEKQSQGVTLSATDQERIDAATQALERRRAELIKEVDLIRQLNERTVETARIFESLIPGSVSNGVVDALQQLIQGLESEVAKIKVEGVASALSQAEIDKRIEAAIGNFRSKLIDIAQLAQSQGAQVPGLFELIADALEGTGKTAEDTSKKIDLMKRSTDGLVSALRTLSQLGRTFGVLSAGASEFLDNITSAIQASDELRKVQERIAAARASGQDVSGGAAFLAQLGPTVGILASTAGAFLAVANQLKASSLRRQEEHRAEIEAMKRLEASLRDSAKSFQRAIDELLGPVVGADVTGGQVDQAREIIKGFGSLIRLAEGGAGRGRGQDEAAAEQARVLIRQLEDTGIQAFEGLSDLFENLVASFGSGQVEDAIRALLTGISGGPGGVSFQGLDSIINELVANLGGVSDSVDGVLEAFDIFSQFLELDAQQGFDAFIRNLLALGDEVLGTDLVGELTKFFEGANLSDENTRGFLNQIIRDIILEITSGGSGLLSGVTQDQLLEILGTLQGFIDGAGNQIVGGSDAQEAISRSVVLGSSITEFQANRLIALNEDAEYTRRAILAQLEAIALAVSSPIGIGANGGLVSTGDNINIDLSGAVIQPNLTDQQIREISVRIAATIRARSFSGSSSNTRF